MQSFIRKLASKNGRYARIIAGVILIVIGFVWPTDSLGWMLIVIGAIPILAAALDVVLIAPLFGLPLKGKDIRKELDK
jgi:hypothetical protein